MGSSQIKDENISIYMTTNKAYYMAGEYVEGQIFLRSLQPSNYLRILVGLEGEEYVHWSESQGRYRRYYTNKYKNYDHQFVIRELNGNLQKGDYVFPFSFLLPKMMTGSFYDSNNCYIKYTLSAILSHPNEPRRSQIYNVPLNILEPPRMGIAPETSTELVESKCCLCCKNYGHTEATLSCDKNFIRNGDHIAVNGKIDNTRGMKDIKYSKVVLERIIFMVTERGKIKTKMMENVELFRLDKIAAKDSKSFFFSAVVPDIFKVPTAIGRIVSSYYLLHLYTQYGCCANKAQAKIHLIFHSTSPIVRQQEFAPQPQNWYPQNFPALIYNNMMPYCYTPQVQIPFLNLWKSDGFANQTQNQQIGNNFMINENIRNPLIQNQQQFGSQQPYFAQNNYSQETYQNRQPQNMLYPDLNNDDTSNRNLDNEGIYKRL